METPVIQDLSINDKKLEVIFCQVCQAPIEYCEYSTTFPECKLWLAQNHPEEFKKLHGDLPENIEPGDTPAPKKGKAKASKPAKIVISVIERTKRKRITQVRGLDKFDVNLKTAAKGMAGKFAAAASVSKLPDGSGSEEILIQGDCADDLVDYILKQFPHIKEDLIEIQEMKSKK